MYLKFQYGGFICWRLERIFLINDSYSWHLMDLRKATLRQPANNQDLYAVFWYQLAGWKASMLSPLHAVSLTWGSILRLHCPFYVLSSFKLSHQSILQKSLNYVLGPWVTSIFFLYFIFWWSNSSDLIEYLALMLIGSLLRNFIIELLLFFYHK